MVLVLWVMSLDSQSVLVSSNMLFPEESLVALHSGSDLELDSVGERVVWVVVTLSIDHPSLVEAVGALVPVNVSSVSVRVSMDVEASNTLVSDVSS